MVFGPFFSSSFFLINIEDKGDKETKPMDAELSMDVRFNPAETSKTCVCVRALWACSAAVSG